MAALHQLLLGSAAADYRISRSLRFNSADSASLTRTNSGSGTNNRKTTQSFWLKNHCKSGSWQSIYWGNNGGVGTGANWHGLFYDGSTGQLKAYFKGVIVAATNPVYRDPNAWMHILTHWDHDNATASQRFRLWVNGVEITSWATDSRSSITGDGWWSNNVIQAIGQTGNSANYADMQLAEFHHIDGTLAAVSSFVATHPIYGVPWPKKYTGSYGTNGFYLSFANNTSTTTLGYDDAGGAAGSAAGSNDWTANNLSVTAGVGNDSLVDTPTNYGTDTGAGGEVRGNYAVMNPLDISGTLATYSNGNLEVTRSGASLAQAYSSIVVTSGKWYVEMTAGADVLNLAPGIITGTTNAGANRFLGQDSFTYAYYAGGQKVNNGSYTAYGSSWTSNDVIGMGLDADNGTLTFYKNGVSQGTAFSSLTGPYRFAVDVENGGICNFNFGQRPFAYAAPSGFKALCTQNIPAGTITTSGSFTGNAAADGPVVQINGVPTAMTINGNAVTFGTHADKLANGFKLRTSSASYNASGSNTFSVTSTGAKFKYARGQANP